MDLVIREVRPGDAPAIVAILNPIIQARVYTVLDARLSVEAERDFIAEFPERGLFHVAEDRGNQKVVGLQTLEPFAQYTHAFDHVAVIATFVDLSVGHRGVGTHLAEVSLKNAKRKGYEKLFTYVRSDNENALNYYSKLGFRVVGTAQRQAKFGELYVDEVIIEKLL